MSPIIVLAAILQPNHFMAGGQATNSGIDYQQRIAAWCLINQYSQIDISIYFDQLDEELIIEKTHFETSGAIDDLNLSCTNSRKLFLQIKRSISLSTREISDFHKTVEQFVQEFIKNERTQNYFGLITTSDASSKITYDLKKIVVSLRLNENAFIDNPLNESEKDTLDKFESVFNFIYEKLKKIKPTKETFYLFVKRVFVAVVDVEAGYSLEIASLMLLRSIGFESPELIWSIMIKNCLIYASNRLSIDQKKLEGIFDKYLGEDKNKSPEEEQLELFKTSIIAEGDYSTAKEVLILESFAERFDCLIVELYRFTDDCTIKNTFYSNKIRIKSGDECTIIQRFSTMAGLYRYLDEHQEIFKDKRLAIMPANDIETVEETECAKLHKTHLETLIKGNENPLLCLHCGKQVSDYNSQLIEVEDAETSAAVGMAHTVCLRPIDRILGTIKIPEKGRELNKHLESFDFKLWVKLVMKGQGMLNALKSSPQLIYGRTPVIAWNGNEEYDPEYSYCIKLNLEDGSTSYSYKRSRIERLNKIQAEEHLKIFNKVQKQQYEKNDPYCVLSITKTAAPYSELLKIKKQDEVILEIKSAEIVKYSKLIAKAFDKDLAHYTPLCIVRDKETETIVNLSNVVPIVSDPLQFNSLYDNWRQIGFGLGDVELKIIKSDKDFDFYMRTLFSDEMAPIVDPLFDKNFNLVSGYPIIEFDKMIENMEQQKGSKINK